MTFSSKFLTPLLIAAAAVACSSSGNSPSAGNGGSSQVAKGGNAGSTSTSGGNGTAQGGNNGNPQGGNTNSTSGGSSNSNAGGNTNNNSGGGSNSNSGGNTNSSTGGNTNTNSGGSPQGGSTSNMGGSTGTGGGSTSGGPAGWWTSWKNEGWHGCAWTAVGAESEATTITPTDFTQVAKGGPYTVTGSVGPTYESVAMVGFNLNQDPAGASCASNPADSMKSYPDVALPTGTGIALNFAKTGAFTLRAQIQGADGNFNADHRWCQTITAVNGKAFLPFNKFNTKCWVSENPTSTEAKGVDYANEKIAAVAFTVPGTKGSATAYNFTINGFTVGTQASDAPDGGVMSGPLTGTIGGAGDMNLDFQRVKVVADGKEYIIQNNNWGNPNGTNQTISYSDNSFKITSPTGGSAGGGVPASFPSIYIGNNGNTANGMTTKSTDGLPKQVSAISSVQTTFTWGGASCGNGFNATYDVWFSASIPTATYNDAISGFVMVWLCDPGDAQPIGSVNRSATIAGNDWDVWVGPRGGSGSNSSAPVVSYVRKGGSINTLTFNLKDFITDASKNGIQNSWYLTDVFAGFEIWNGGATNGLGVNKFTCVVQ